MRPEELFKIIDGIDDDIILDIPEITAEKPIKVVIESKRTSFWTIAVSAACLLCVLAIGVFIAVKLQSGQRIEPEPGSKISEPPSSTIWYKDIMQDTGNAFDYTELAKQVPQIEPKDRKEFLALSEEQINSMTTAELLVTCLDYPLFGDMFFYEGVNGFAALVEQYNGLQALLERNDAGEVLGTFYCAVDLDAVVRTDEYGALRFVYLNNMLSYGDLLSSMSPKTRRELFDKCVSDHKTINECYSTIFNSFQTARIAVKLRYIDSPEFREFADNNDSVVNFINGSGSVSVECWEEIWRQIESKAGDDDGDRDPPPPVDNSDDQSLPTVDMEEDKQPGDNADDEGKPPVKPNAYLSTKPATFEEAKKQIEFVDVKEISGADFIGYELDYVMPSEWLFAFRYVFVDGEVTVRDNRGDFMVIVISPELYEKIERDNMIFWKSTFDESPTVTYISESNVAYFGTFESDADLSKAIAAIKSLV